MASRVTNRFPDVNWSHWQGPCHILLLARVPESTSTAHNDITWDDSITELEGNTSAEDEQLSCSLKLKDLDPELFEYQPESPEDISGKALGNEELELMTSDQGASKPSYYYNQGSQDNTPTEPATKMSESGYMWEPSENGDEDGHSEMKPVPDICKYYIFLWSSQCWREQVLVVKVPLSNSTSDMDDSELASPPPSPKGHKYY